VKRKDTSGGKIYAESSRGEHSECRPSGRRPGEKNGGGGFLGPLTNEKKRSEGKKRAGEEIAPRLSSHQGGRKCRAGSKKLRNPKEREGRRGAYEDGASPGK